MGGTQTCDMCTLSVIVDRPIGHVNLSTVASRLLGGIVKAASLRSTVKLKFTHKVDGDTRTSTACML